MVPKALLVDEQPLASGPRVFTTAEYAKAIGRKSRQARERLYVLLEDGKVERVKTKRNGTIVSAWRYVGR